jgi:hypothetical protein
MLSMLAGCASTLFSATRPAARYWVTMSPEWRPVPSMRKFGRPELNLASCRRAVRRSLREPISQSAILRKSAAMATGSPWKLPPE